MFMRKTMQRLFSQHLYKDEKVGQKLQFPNKIILSDGFFVVNGDFMDSNCGSAAVLRFVKGFL